MSIRNPEAVIDAVSVVLPDANRTTTVTSDPIDCRGKSQLIVLVHYGVITDGTFTPSITTSATSGGSYAADTTNVSGTLTPGTAAADERVVAFTWNVDPAKPFARVVLTASGSPETGGEFAVMALRNENRYRP